MIYFLLAIVVFFIYKLTVSWLQFRNLKDRTDYELDKIQFKIESDPDNPLLYCKRGTIHQMGQNLKSADLDFRRALDMIRKGFPIENKVDVESKLLMNLRYTEKPLPWTKSGPKDYSNNWFMYFLIERLGGRRYNF